MNFLYSIYSTFSMPQTAHEELSRIWHRTDELYQSNVFDWSATNCHSSNPTKHMWQQECEMQWPESPRVDCLFHSIQTLLQTNRVFLCGLSYVLGMKRHYSKRWKYFKTSNSQHCANQETDKCCVVPCAQRLGRLAGQWMGLKQCEQTERWRKTQMDSDT